MLYSLLVQILTTCGRILARLIDKALADTRRFNRIDDALGRAEAQAFNRHEEVMFALTKVLTAVEPVPVAVVVIDVFFEGQIIQGATHMQLKDSEKFDFTLTGADAKGAPAAIDGTKTTAAIDDTEVATVTLNPDGLGGTVTGAKPGSTQLKVSVADATNAGDSVSGTLDLVVVAGDVATIQIGTSAPVAQ